MNGATGVRGRVIIAVAVALLLGVGAYLLDRDPLPRALQSERNEQLATEVSLDPEERAARVHRGRELTTQHCCRCHGPDLRGGRVEGVAADVPLAANLVPDGAARYTREEFCRILNERVRSDGSMLNPVMPAVMQQLAAGDAEAIWYFLQTLPPDSSGAPRTVAH